LSDTQQEPQVGDRFKLSALGAERCPGLAGKVGTVINRRPDSRIVTVQFDGNRNSTSLHRDYIEPTEA
jgi:ribosomal protein L21E